VIYKIFSQVEAENTLQDGNQRAHHCLTGAEGGGWQNKRPQDVLLLHAGFEAWALFHYCGLGMEHLLVKQDPHLPQGFPGMPNRISHMNSLDGGFERGQKGAAAVGHK
jgi:hypothetical protein